MEPPQFSTQKQECRDRCMAAYTSWYELSICHCRAKKKESLMSTYRLHSRKRKESGHSGASTDELYTTNWFAYTLMDSFLGPVYNKDDNMTINTEVSEMKQLNCYLFILCRYVFSD